MNYKLLDKHKILILTTALLIILVLSQLALSQTSIYDKEGIFISLKSNDAYKKEAVFTINNPSVSALDKSNIELRFNEVCGEVTSYQVLKRTLCHSVKYYYDTYQECEYNSTLKKEGCVEEINLSSYQYTDIYRLCYEPIDNIPAGEEDYKIQASISIEECNNGKWGYAVDWIPSITIEGKTYEEEAWAWFNVSYDRRRNVTNLTSSDIALSINGTNGWNNTHIWINPSQCPGTQIIQIYYSSTNISDYQIVCNETTIMNFDTEGTGRDYNASGVYRNTAKSILHMGETGVVVDSSNYANATNHGATWGVSNGKYGGGYFLDGTNDYINYTQTSLDRIFDNNFSVIFWFNINWTTSDEDTGRVFMMSNDFDFECLTTNNADKEIRGYFFDGAHQYTGISTEVPEEWIMISFIKGSVVGMDLYFNDSLNVDSAITSDGQGTSNVQYVLGGYPLPTNTKYVGGYYDEFRVYNETLTSAEIEVLYNNSQGLNLLLGTIETASANYFTVTTKDEYDSTAINNFTAIINGTTYNTTNGTINSIVLNNAATYISVNITSNDSGGYFDRDFWVNCSSDLDAALRQAIADFEALEKITNNSLTGKFAINGTNITSITNVTLTAANYNFTFYNNSYYTYSEIINIPALYNGTVNLNDAYNTIVNVTVKNAYTGTNLTNFTGWVYMDAYSYNETFDDNGTGSALVNLIYGNYTFFATHPDYAINNLTNYQDVTLNETFHNLTFELYTSNSIVIHIYDEATSTLITGTNITITITGNATEDIYYTVNGTYYIDNLTDGNYSVKFAGGNYTVKTYTVTVAERSTQNLDAYLSTAYQTVTFTIRNILSGATVENVAFNMARMINGSWVTVESKNSDITGRVQVSYLASIKYRFTLTHSNYYSKLFYLDPVIFDSYDVQIEPVLSGEQTQDYAEINIIYYPKKFYNNYTNNFTFIINSPEGALNYYTLSLVYPGGSDSRNGNNALGESFTVNFNITGAGMFDKVNITYTYDSTTGLDKNFTFSYGILGGLATNQTFAGFTQQDYGLGLFEKITIATLSVLVLAGITFLVAGLGGSLLMGMLGLGFFVYLGFIPLWSILITLFVGTVILIATGTRS